MILQVVQKFNCKMRSRYFVTFKIGAHGYCPGISLRSRCEIIDPALFLKLMRLGNATFSAGIRSFFDRLIDESFSAVDLSITNCNYRILGSLWNLSVRTRPTGTLRNGAAPGGPTVCISCGTGALSSLSVRCASYVYARVACATHLS